MAAPLVFDRTLLRARRARALRHFDDFDFLYRATAAQLIDRLSMVRKALPVVADLGAGTSTLSKSLRGRKGTELVVSLDMAPALLRGRTMACAADEDALPLAPESCDAIVANLSLQWVNDLPGALTQIRRALKPDGVFLAALIGGESLRELRHALTEAEIATRGGVSPRLSPVIDMQDMAALMQRAGFALPVVDRDMMEVDYASPFSLMHDLRGMGAANATFARDRRPAPRRMMLEAARIYQENFPSGAQGEGGVIATFEVIYVIGWAPDASQPQPLKPGTAGTSLAEALGGGKSKIS